MSICRLVGRYQDETGLKIDGLDFAFFAAACRAMILQETYQTIGINLFQVRGRSRKFHKYDDKEERQKLVLKSEARAKRLAIIKLSNFGLILIWMKLCKSYPLRIYK